MLLLLRDLNILLRFLKEGKLAILQKLLSVLDINHASVIVNIHRKCRVPKLLLDRVILIDQFLVLDQIFHGCIINLLLDLG